MGCEFIATGHYAKVNFENDRYFISKAKDPRKDQSYVLWGLSQECLERTKFPLAPYTKEEVRKMAFDWGYESLSKKAESYEICFVPENDYRSFLKHRIPEQLKALEGGQFLNTKGEKIGRHKGYPFYTIGQRKGLGKAFGKPMYVTEIIANTNTVVLGEVEDLMRNGMMVDQLNLMKYEQLDSKKEFVTQVRYNDPGTLSHVEQFGSMMNVEFLANVKGIAPGQSAVFFEGDDVVGGGIIRSSLQLN
jgi:tRNA-specific 2-thiouridylase